MNFKPTKLKIIVGFIFIVLWIFSINIYNSGRECQLPFFGYDCLNVQMCEINYYDSDIGEYVCALGYNKLRLVIPACDSGCSYVPFLEMFLGNTLNILIPFLVMYLIYSLFEFDNDPPKNRSEIEKEIIKYN